MLKIGMIRSISRALLQTGLQCRQLSAATTQVKPIELSIRKKLESLFEPTHMEVINESYMHNVPKGSETHFKVVVVSELFHGIPSVKRHRLVNDVLEAEIHGGGVHGLSIVAKSPEQWEESHMVTPSPGCKGGAGL